MPRCFDAFGSVRARRMPHWLVSAFDRPDLLAVDDEAVAVALGAGLQAGEIATGPGSLNSCAHISLRPATSPG
jgi:hypothetical protein